MSSEVILKFAKKGMNLTPEAYNKILSLNNPLDAVSSIILKLKSNKYFKEDLVIVNEKIIDEIIESLNENISKDKEIGKNTFLKTNEKNLVENSPSKLNNSQKTFNQKESRGVVKKETSEPKNELNKEKNIESINNESKEEIDENSVENLIKNPQKVSGEVKSNFKRNMVKTDVKYDFKILQDTSKKSYTSGEMSNLISYFKSRYEKISKILLKRPELKLTQKVSEIEESQKDLSLILMVRDIRTTKNGHKLIEFEDDTGTIPVLVSKDNGNLMREAEKLVKDEIVGIIASKNGDLAIANQIIHPDIQRHVPKDMDFGIVFLSDVHIGSLTFLEDAFKRFIKWINCEYGNEDQVKIAENVKYLIIGGDIVDGVGVYPNQEKELGIKDITQQYTKAAEYLGEVRSDVKIIITPGNHDASRVAEPQPAVPEKYAKALYELDNVEFISNPGYVSLDGINVLIYHGRSFDDLAMSVKGFSHEENDILMEELLKKRHLAPIYGERTPLASELEDYLVIDEVPDVFHTGHVHINTYRKYKGVHLINSGTFQTQTEFQKIYNIIPTPAEVPVLDNGDFKFLKFID